MTIHEWLLGIERAIPEGPGEVAATVVVVVAVIAVRRAAGRWQEANRTSEGDGEPSRLRLFVSGLVTLFTGLGVLALVAVWGLVSPLVNAYADLGLDAIGGRLVLASVLVVAAYALVDLVRRILDEVIGRRDDVSEHQREILYRLTQVTAYALVGLTVLTLFTNDPSSLLVGAGFLGIVVGMAARQTLGAMLAGFVLMFSRPFEIGDWVVIGDREGIVTGITVVNTRLRTFDGEHVMLPNDEVSSSPIVNRTRQGRLRLEVEVGVDYDADPTAAAEVAHDAITDLDEILSVPRPQVVVKRFGDSAVVLGVRVWIDNPSARRKWRARTAVVAAVHDAFSEADIAIPFPQRELSARDGEAVLAGSPERAVDAGSGSPDAAPPEAAPGGGSETDGGTDRGATDDGDGDGDGGTESTGEAGE
ncbi:MAG: mechanosensitive ion channel family protein [Haloferacaceae archaeon]